MNSWASIVSVSGEGSNARVKENSTEGVKEEILEKKRYFVVDTNAIIRGVQIQQLSNEIYTTKEVLNEIRDKNARKFLSNLQMDIKVKEPDQDSLKAVIQFAKKTGDLRSLSKADVKVIALTYMLEKELNGVSHLRKEPINLVANYDPNKKDGGLKKAFSKKNGRDKEPQSCHEKEGINHVIKESKQEGEESVEENMGEKMEEKKEDIVGEKMSDEGESKKERDLVQNSEKEEEVEGEKKEEEKEEKKEEAKKEEEIVQAENKEEGMEENEEEEEDWITPDNYQSKLDASVNIMDSMGDTYVACITSDFAMQNVILQMGLNLLSAKGLAIKRVKQWAIKCFSCFQFVFISNIVFFFHLY